MISPGNSPGTLSINGDLTWSGGGNYEWEIFNATGSPGTGWDLIDVSGSLLFADLSAGNKFNINIFSLSGLTPDVIGALSDFNPSGTYTWKILSAGSITGFDASYFNLNTASFVANNAGADGSLFSLAAQDGDLYLAYNGGGPEPVPEPGTWLSAGLLLSCALWRRIRARIKKSTLTTQTSSLS
jgi:hypothetical protein